MTYRYDIIHDVNEIAAEWDEFVASDADGSFFHTTDYLRYALACDQANTYHGITVRDNDGHLVGVAPFIQSQDQFLMHGEPGAWPLVPSFDTVWRTINRHARDRGIKTIGIRTHPGGTTNRAWMWNQQWLTSAVDLQTPEELLWRQVRRSYHAIINGGRKRLTILLLTPAEFMKECVSIHRTAAGRQTRDDRSWAVQSRWIRLGQAVCLAAYDDNRAVGFAFATIYRGWAYYFSGASTEPNIQHALQWEMIRTLKQRSVLYYELGWLDRHTDDKNRGIAMFKSGFGGTNMRVLALVVDPDDVTIR